MRKLLMLLVVIFLIVKVEATEFLPPEAPMDAQKLMDSETESFGEGLLFVLQTSADLIYPSLMEAAKVCASVVAISLTTGLLSGMPGDFSGMVELIGTIGTGIVLFQPANSLIRLGEQTVQQISQYGKLLLPVMTAALAAQGGLTKSGALYTATAFFDALLCGGISELLRPLLYVFLCVAIVSNMFSQPIMQQLQKFIKWLMTWGLKTILYIFTGYISITGVVAGSADAAALKATKLTISGTVPVVGNILSDASEAVLSGVGLMKNAAGTYGLLAVIALWIDPFIRIGAQYVMLNITSGICQMMGSRRIGKITKDFSAAMGLVLAMTGAVCVIFLVSVICFMKGVG